jgi:hypothetical protein
LRARVAELEAERHSTNEALDDAVKALRANADAVADRIVAYRDPSNPQTLLCREHGQHIAWVNPVTSADLPDGGFCTYGRMTGLECGKDVLIDGPESGGGA